MRAFALVVALALLAITTSAGAEPDPAWPREKRSYATPLAWSYAIPIGVEAASWIAGGVAPERPSTYRDIATGAAILAWPAMWIAPPSVHIANGQPLRGLVAFGGSLGFTALGLGVGYLVWLPIAQSMSDGAHSCCEPWTFTLWAGFGLAGDALWAVIDVNNHASVPVEDVSRAPALRFAGAGLVPVRGGLTTTATFLF